MRRAELSDPAARVLMLATRVPCRSGDGTPSFVLDNAVSLADRYDVTLLAPRVGGCARSTRSGGLTVKRFAYLPRRWETLADDAIMPQLGRNPLLWFQAFVLFISMLAAALREQRRARFSLVHAQWILPAGLIALALRWIFGTPFIITSRGADAFRLERGPLASSKRVVVARASRLIAVSDEIARRFAGCPAPVAVQPSGVDFELWRRLVGPRVPDDATVLFIGRLAAKKGTDDAVRAVAGLPGVRLRIVGDGPEREALRLLIEDLGVTDRVQLLGQLEREGVADELRTATCVVIPSVVAPDGDRDGTPNVLGEAAAAGVPVVASRIAGLEEYVDDGTSGLLHPPGDVEGIRRGIKRILSDPAGAARIAERAALTLEEVLDMPRVADRHVDWYREAMSGGRSE